MGNTREKYDSGNHTVYRCSYHVVFCPKYRRKVLVDKVAERLKVLFYETAKERGFSIESLEIMPDHVHALLFVPPWIKITTALKYLKGKSSRILSLEFPDIKKKVPTLWSHSKFVSTIGNVSEGVVKQYIESQTWSKTH